MLPLALFPTALLPSPAVRHATAVPRNRAAAMDLRELTIERADGTGSYGVSILRNGPLASYYPPVVMVPPVGVGIDRKFYDKLLDEWERLGLPVELHALDLLGCGSSRPLPRKFYTPEVWAEQVLEYVQTSVGRPVVLMVQSGMAPIALETWRMGGGRPTIAGVIFMSPPPFQFFATRTAAIAADYDEQQLALILPPRTRRRQRLFWLLAQSSVGGFAFRYLRGKRGKRIREFSEANLFARTATVDEKWVEQCLAAAKPTRTRHATFSYLCGTIPDGGCWRDDRSELLDSLDVPCQVIRGDNVPDAAERLRAASELLTMLSCCAVVKGARSVLPYEAPRATAELVARFMATNFDDGGTRLSDAVKGRLWGGGKLVQAAEGTQPRCIGGLYDLQQ